MDDDSQMANTTLYNIYHVLYAHPHKGADWQGSPCHPEHEWQIYKYYNGALCSISVVLPPSVKVTEQTYI